MTIENWLENIQPRNEQQQKFDEKSIKTCFKKIDNNKPLKCIQSSQWNNLLEKSAMFEWVDHSLENFSISPTQ